MKFGQQVDLRLLPSDESGSPPQFPAPRHTPPLCDWMDVVSLPSPPFVALLLNVEDPKGKNEFVNIGLTAMPRKLQAYCRYTTSCTLPSDACGLNSGPLPRSLRAPKAKVRLRLLAA